MHCAQVLQPADRPVDIDLTLEDESIVLDLTMD